MWLLGKYRDIQTYIIVYRSNNGHQAKFYPEKESDLQCNYKNDIIICATNKQWHECMIKMLSWQSPRLKRHIISCFKIQLLEFLWILNTIFRILFQRKILLVCKSASCKYWNRNQFLNSLMPIYRMWRIWLYFTKLGVFGSDNGLMFIWCLANIGTNACILNWTLGNNIQQTLNQNAIVFFQENAFEMSYFNASHLVWVSMF